MKEKIIEKRVMKMKKVFVTLLMLMMVVRLFAAVAGTDVKGSDTLPDSIKISATVTGGTAIYFADGESSTTVANEKEILPIGADNNKVTADIYAVCETNSATPITLNLYGTALTLSSGENGYNSKGKVDLTATVSNVKGITELPETTSVTFDDVSTSDIATNGTTTDLASIPFGEASADAAGKRTLRAKISLEADMTDKTAGTYDSYLILEVAPGQE